MENLRWFFGTWPNVWQGLFSGIVGAFLAYVSAQFGVKKTLERQDASSARAEALAAIRELLKMGADSVASYSVAPPHEAELPITWRTFEDMKRISRLQAELQYVMVMAERGKIGDLSTRLAIYEEQLEELARDWSRRPREVDDLERFGQYFKIWETVSEDCLSAVRSLC